jgi:hypothetical protein
MLNSSLFLPVPLTDHPVNLHNFKWNYQEFCPLVFNAVSPEKVKQHFGEKYGVYFQGRRLSKASVQHETAWNHYRLNVIELPGAI